MVVNFKIFTTSQSSEWDETVKSFENYDVYYLSGYIKALEVNGDGQGLLFYYDDGKTRAINAVIKRTIDEEYCDFITPYGYGGFLIEGDTERVFEEYDSYCKENKVVCEFVRFHPVIKNEDNNAVLIGKTISIDTLTEEDYNANCKSENRTRRRKAIKSGVTVEQVEPLSNIDKFIEIYNHTMDRDNATNYYYFKKEYYLILFKELKENILMYCAKKDDDIIAMAIIFVCSDYAQYHLSGALREYMSLAPTNLLLHTVAVDCANRKIKQFHLGGGLGAEEDNLYRFKKTFNKKGDLNYYIGKKIFNEEKYNTLCKEKEIDINSDFFPAYRSKD